MKTLYRYEDDPPIYDRPPSFTLYRYKVERETKYCYFVRKIGICSFISFKLRKMFKNAKRPFAHETIEEAQQAYIRTKFSLKKLIMYQDLISAYGDGTIH